MLAENGRGLHVLDRLRPWAGAAQRLTALIAVVAVLESFHRSYADVVYP